MSLKYFIRILTSCTWFYTKIYSLIDKVAYFTLESLFFVLLWSLYLVFAYFLIAFPISYSIFWLYLPFSFITPTSDLSSPTFLLLIHLPYAIVWLLDFYPLKVPLIRFTSSLPIIYLYHSKLWLASLSPLFFVVVFQHLSVSLLQSPSSHFLFLCLLFPVFLCPVLMFPAPMSVLATLPLF